MYTKRYDFGTRINRRLVRSTACNKIQVCQYIMNWQVQYRVSGRVHTSTHVRELARWIKRDAVAVVRPVQSHWTSRKYTRAGELTQRIQRGAVAIARPVLSHSPVPPPYAVPWSSFPAAPTTRQTVPMRYHLRSAWSQCVVPPSTTRYRMVLIDTVKLDVSCTGYDDAQSARERSAHTRRC